MSHSAPTKHENSATIPDRKSEAKDSIDSFLQFMLHSAPAKHENSATMPYRKIGGKDYIKNIVPLPGGQRIITNSRGGSLRIWDLGRGIQVEEWEDKFFAIALSPDGKTLASGSGDGAVKLWSIDTGKVIRTLTGHTESDYVCWSPDGGRVLGGSTDGTFRVWDVKSGKTILGPIKAELEESLIMMAVCYSPDATMIATAGDFVEIWDANTGNLLEIPDGSAMCLAWTSNGKTLVTGGVVNITKLNTATWTRSKQSFMSCSKDYSSGASETTAYVLHNSPRSCQPRKLERCIAVYREILDP